MSRTAGIVVATCVLAVCIAPSQGAFVVGAFDSSRAGEANVISGKYSEDCIAALSANFPDATFATSPTLTPQFLSGVNVLVLTPAVNPSTAIDPLSQGEQEALVEFVKAGGRALLIGEADPWFIAVTQTFMGPFGVTYGDDFQTGVRFGSPIEPSHPVLDGPFGEVPVAAFYGTGRFTGVQPYVTPLMETVDGGDLVLAALESHAIGPNSGRVVLIGDSTPFIDEADGGFFVLPQHQALFLNSIHYLATPEPSTSVLAGIAGGLFVLRFGVRRFRRRRSVNAVYRSRVTVPAAHSGG